MIYLQFAKRPILNRWKESSVADTLLEMGRENAKKKT